MKLRPGGFSADRVFRRFLPRGLLGRSLLIVGGSADPARFTERLRAAMESLRGSYGGPDFMEALQVQNVGAWHYPAEENKAVERVLGELSSKTAQGPGPAALVPAA